MSTPSRERTPMEILDAMTGRGVPVETIKEMVGLVERFEDRKARKVFVQSFLEFRKACPVLVKSRPVVDKHGKHLYDYANFEDVVRAVEMVLLANGFTYRFDSEELESGKVKTTCTLEHVGGHSVQASFTCRVMTGSSLMSNTQCDGGTVSTGKRYALLAALGIPTEGDDDGRKDQNFAPTPEKKETTKPAGAKSPMRILFERWFSVLHPDKAMYKAAPTEFVEWYKTRLAITVDEIDQDQIDKCNVFLDELECR